jgi:hypothetical protein
VNRGGGDVSAAASSLTTNSWAHLAVTYDGSALRLYVNGTPVSSRSASGDIIGTGGAAVDIGADEYHDDTP